MVDGPEQAVGLSAVILLALACTWMVYDYGHNGGASADDADRDRSVAMVTLGGVERVEIVHLPGLDFPMEARIDTGADLSSLDARCIKEFKKGDRTWVGFQIVERASGKRVELSVPVSRYVNIKRHGLPDQCRPVVCLDLMVGSQVVTSAFTLTDRSKFRYPALIGRSFLAGRAVVDVSRSHLVSQ